MNCASGTTCPPNGKTCNCSGVPGRTGPDCSIIAGERDAELSPVGKRHFVASWVSDLFIGSKTITLLTDSPRVHLPSASDDKLNQSAHGIHIYRQGHVYVIYYVRRG